MAGAATRPMYGERGEITMAERRMFSGRVVRSAKFLRLPASAQALYFHLGMNTDDEGIVEAFAVMRMIQASDEDLQALEDKGLVAVLDEDELVIYITDWNESNQIRPDRAKESVYHSLLVSYMNRQNAADCQRTVSNIPQHGGNVSVGCQQVDNTLTQADSNMSATCQQNAADCPQNVADSRQNVSELTAKCGEMSAQYSIGEVSIGKGSIHAAAAANTGTGAEHVDNSVDKPGQQPKKQGPVQPAAGSREKSAQKQQAASKSPTRKTASKKGIGDFKRRLDQDEGFAEVAQLYQDNIHDIPNQVEADDLMALYDEYGREWLINAVKEAARARARSIKYVVSVLSSWSSRGVPDPWNYRDKDKGKVPVGVAVLSSPQNGQKARTGKTRSEQVADMAKQAEAILMASGG